MSLATRQLWQARLFPGAPDMEEPGPRRQNARPEAALLNAIMQMLRVHPKVYFRVRLNSGGFKDSRGQFVRFGFVGCPDVWGMMRKSGKLFCLEIKAADGRVTREQAAFLEMVKAGGGIAGVVRSIGDALKLIDAED